MRYVTINTVRLVLLAALFWGPPAMADSLFTIENPEVDFQVIDADDGSGEYFFDGIGDFGPFDTFGDVALGSFGEARSMVEFDISEFAVPDGEIIVNAFLEVRYSGFGVWGLGIEGEPTESVAVDGYIGNGLQELSDFQIADGNVLDSVATPSGEAGDILRFSITPFTTDVVNGGETWLGLTLRAETFGGHQFWENSNYPYPKLVIQTAVPEPGTLAVCAAASLALLRRRRGA
jgi:hypothetical protein